MAILVTGAHGMVGSYFKSLADRFDQALDLTDVDSLDVTDLEAVRARIQGGSYSAIVNLVGATDVDRCETDPVWAYRLNALGAWNCALVAEAEGLELVHVSTTALFGGDGALGPFSEVDTPVPPNHYARTKWEGERCVFRACRRSWVVRTAWVMGGGAVDKKFVGKVRDRLLGGEPIKAVADQWGSPTYAHDLVLLIRALMQTGAYGLYHGTNQGRASRYDMALEMKRLLDSSSTITEASAADFPLPAARSTSDVSVSVALPARGLGDLMPTWQDALGRYLASWPSD
jgi:dTDP-4-dehydrorhamnose reductase